MTLSEKHELLRRVYRISHPLALGIGLWAAISGTAALVLLVTQADWTLPGCGRWGNDSALAVLFPTWAEVLWALMYAVGGAFLAKGVWSMSLRSEVAGCVAVAGTQLVNVYAITVIRGPAAGFISGVGFAVAGGLISRCVLLLRGRRAE